MKIQFFGKELWVTWGQLRVSNSSFFYYSKWYFDRKFRRALHVGRLVIYYW